MSRKRHQAILNLQQKILDHLAARPCLKAVEIAKAVGEPEFVVQKCLHEMDDAGQVIMKNGFYRLAEAENLHSQSRYIETLI